MTPYLGLKCLIVLSAVFSETGLQCAAITVIPNVAVALINDSTYFNCSTTSETVEWLFSSDEDLYQSVIYSYGTVKALYKDRFRVEKYANNTGKQFDLALQSVAKDDAGRYICRDPDRNEEGEAQLIVLETQPVCKSNLNVDGLIGPNSCALKPETVQLSCSVSYSGKQFPELQWIKIGENIAINSSMCSHSGNIYTCNLTMESELQMEGSSYVCQTKQSMTRQYNCTEGVFRMIYALGDHTELNGTVNDKVNCSVNSSSQSCTSSWIFDNGTTNWTESNDPVIMLKRPGRFICEANCPIRNINCIFTSMTVNVDSVHQGDGNNTIVGIIVAIVVVAAAVIGIGLIVFIVWKKRKQNKQKPLERELMVPKVGNAGGAVAGNIVPRKITPLVGKNHDKRVRGLTILNDELFVAFEKSSIIEVFPVNFDMSSHKSLEVADLVDPGTIAACAKYNCLYVIDQTDSSNKKIFRVKPDGEVIKIWETADDKKGRISVNHDGNIVMTVHGKKKLKIYSPEGKLIRKTTIDFWRGKRITCIFHAINLADGTFIICHGIYKSKLHQVCKIDAKGKVLQSFGNEKGSGDAQLDCPAYVAERNDGSILVADRDNDRIILLNSELKFVEELFTKEKCDVSRPGFMFVYEDTDTPLLFLGCNKLNSGGYVLVLKLGQ